MTNVIETAQQVQMYPLLFLVQQIKQNSLTHYTIALAFITVRYRNDNFLVYRKNLEYLSRKTKGIGVLFAYYFTITWRT